MHELQRCRRNIPNMSLYVVTETENRQNVIFLSVCMVYPFDQIDNPSGAPPFIVVALISSEFTSVLGLMLFCISAAVLANFLDLVQF